MVIFEKRFKSLIFDNSDDDKATSKAYFNSYLQSFSLKFTSVGFGGIVDVNVGITVCPDSAGDMVGVGMDLLVC